MFTLLLSVMGLNLPETVTIPAPGVPGGQVVIVLDREKMKAKDGCVKHVVLPVEPKPKK